MLVNSLAVFAGAFLLFLVQPITAKQILPSFGGSASVWVTCLVFFQVVLLLGYAYSDWTRWRLPLRWQALLHGFLLVLSLTFLPITLDASRAPDVTEYPVWRLLGMLTVTIGLPFFLLSATSPMIQSWSARVHPQSSPYRLFALSNLASMLALLAYPSVIEPWLGTSAQSRIWSLAYVVFVVLCCAAAVRGARLAVSEGVSRGDPPPRDLLVAPPASGAYLLWVTLAAMGSFFLVAVSNHLSQDVAAVPLLWVLPLSIYLLTFTLSFDRRHWYRRDLFMGMLAAALCVMVWRPRVFSPESRLLFEIGLFSAGLFVVCMFCHGELSRLRPAARYLTRFYLMIAIGGAVGAVLVGIVAPLVFSGFYELDVGLALLAALGLYQAREYKAVLVGLGCGVLLFTVGGAIYRINSFASETVLIKRNFYGVLRVKEHYDRTNPERYRLELLHGAITHGDQLPHPRFRRAVGTYYRTTSGIGRALRALRRTEARVGVVGLGVGTLAAYGRPGDVYRFYEINPEVVRIAREEFTYLRDSLAKIEIVPGDARVSLEREPDQQFDVLVVDAFSGDAVPVHLLTSEALAMYRRHVRPGGVIAFHVSNQFLDLALVVKRLADAHGMEAAYVIEDARNNGGFDSHWVLLSRDRHFLDRPEIRTATSPLHAPSDLRLWTDGYSNLIQVWKQPGSETTDVSR